MRNRQNNLHDAPELGFVLGGRFELVRFLGAGGMGAVYEAVATDSRRVAVKVMLEASLSERGAELVERFKREIVVTSTLQSPHIVPTLDAGMDDEIGAPFLVMPLLSGLDLARQIERSGALHPTVAARVFRQGCRAVQRAHEAEVIHRDIKPANFFLEHHPSGEVTVRLFDFGIAKCTIGPNTELTRTGSLLGTLDYMAPEQREKSKSADRRADIYALGATLYHLTTGSLPFEGTSEEVLAKQVLESLSGERIRALNLSPQLHYFLEKMMAKDPEMRFQGPEQLRKDVQVFLDQRKHERETEQRQRNRPKLGDRRNRAMQDRSSRRRRR